MPNKEDGTDVMEGVEVLIVEDDDMLREYLAQTFRAHGCRVQGVDSGEAAIKVAEGAELDLILLDIGLPGMDGFEVVRSLRGGGDTTPLIMLTSFEEEEGLVRSLQLGADDFVRKPFSMAELLAHGRALLRRVKTARGTILRHGEFELDLQRRRAERRGEVIRLTDLQFKILTALMIRKGDLVTRAELLQEVWGMEFDPNTKIVEVQMTYLRRKLGSGDSGPIETVRQQGYRMRRP